MYTQSMLKPLLTKLGLNESEIAVYSYLVKHPFSTPALVARQTKLNRPTVYNICKKLALRGLVIEDLGDKTLKLLATPGDELPFILKRDEEELRAKTKTIEALANELSLMKSSRAYPVPKIRFIEQDKIMQYLHSQTPVWDTSIANYDNIWWGFQDHTFVEQYREWIEWYWAKAAPDISLYMLSNSAKIEETMKIKQRHLKPWEKGVHFSATTWVLGDYLVMIVTDKEPFYLVEIHDERMAHNFRELFKNIWGLV